MGGFVCLLSFSQKNYNNVFHLSDLWYVVHSWIHNGNTSGVYNVWPCCVSTMGGKAKVWSVSVHLTPLFQSTKAVNKLVMEIWNKPQTVSLSFNLLCKGISQQHSMHTPVMHTWQEYACYLTKRYRKPRLCVELSICHDHSIKSACKRYFTAQHVVYLKDHAEKE